MVAQQAGVSAQPRDAVGTEEDVSHSEVGMPDATTVTVPEGRGECSPEFDRLVDEQRAGAPEPVIESLAAQRGHDEPAFSGRMAVEPATVEDAQHTAMVESRRQP
nr:hypothetical protein [Pseudonocardia sp. C8]